MNKENLLNGSKVFLFGIIFAVLSGFLIKLMEIDPAMRGINMTSVQKFVLIGGLVFGAVISVVLAVSLVNLIARIMK